MRKHESPPLHVDIVDLDRVCHFYFLTLRYTLIVQVQYRIYLGKALGV